MANDSQPRSRPPAVAGSFYPGSGTDLATTVQELLGSIPSWGTGKAPPKAVIAPHAGYVYSGATAARALSALAAGSTALTRVVLMGPAHRVTLRGLALPASVGFTTPLGEVPVDVELGDKLVELFPHVRKSDQAHALEHSLEVELPFLQTLLGEFLILPLVVGEASAEEVAQVLDYAWGDDETRVVVSSDLSHYLPYDDARRVDLESAQKILDLEPTLDHRRACGATPINGLLAVARRKNLKAEMLELLSSGDTAGDRSRVVGYGAFAFSSHA